MEIRTVFDTNIWISYFIKGKFLELVEYISEHSVEFFRCDDLTIELYSVLSRKKFKKYLTLPIEDYINFYESLTNWIATQHTFELCRDRKDNFLFDLANQSNAKFLVSGDKDVREITKEYNLPFSIITLSEFKKSLQVTR